MRRERKKNKGSPYTAPTRMETSIRLQDQIPDIRSDSTAVVRQGLTAARRWYNTAIITVDRAAGRPASRSAEQLLNNSILRAS